MDHYTKWRENATFHRIHDIHGGRSQVGVDFKSRNY